MTVNVGLHIRLGEAKSGKESECQALVEEVRSLVEDEPATIGWFGFRENASSFYIFEAFPDEAGRQAHMSGKAAELLLRRAPEVFNQEPDVEYVETFARKLPGRS